MILSPLTENNRIEKMYPAIDRMNVVLDTDAYNEVDDQFAIAYALTSENRINLEAVYVAPFSSTFFQNLLNTEQLAIPMLSDLEKGVEMSYKEILRIYELLGLDSSNKVFYGSRRYLTDVNNPVKSDAALDLIERALSSEDTLYVVCIGAITNVASAILLEPKIIEKISIVWLAGQPLTWPQTIEFNICQDILASQTILNSKVPLTLVPCMSVASLLTTTEAELNYYLNGKSEIGSFLSERVINELDENSAEAWLTLFRETYNSGLDDYGKDITDNFSINTKSAPSRIVWDISTIGYLNNPFWCPSTLVNAPILKDDMTWELDNSRHKIRVVNFVYRDSIFGDLFYKLSNV